MARAIGLVLLGLGGWLALCALGGCNAILDIEQAQLSSGGKTGSAGSTGSAGVGTPPGLTCEDPVSAGCLSCLNEKCKPGELATCLGDTNCRRELVGYSDCLGPNCTDNQGQCFEPFASAKPVPSCIGTCAAACSSSPIESACEVYCGCMQTNCLGTFASTADCISNCASNVQTIRCRLSHCEIAPFYDGESVLHCGHAVGHGLCGDSYKPPPAPDCANKFLNSFACTDKTQCCSGNCDEKSRSCAPP